MHSAPCDHLPSMLNAFCRSWQPSVASSLRLAVTSSAEDGIYGSYPATICEFGSRMESRMYRSSAMTVLLSWSGTGLPFSPSSVGARSALGPIWQPLQSNSRNRRDAFAKGGGKPANYTANTNRLSGKCSLPARRAHIEITPRYGSPRGQVGSLPSPRQARFPHQELVHRVRALAAFADRPYHQRLTAPHVACREHLRIR